METVLSVIGSLCVVSIAIALAAVAIARAKAPPESNEQLALKVSKIQIELEDVFDALDRWGKRQAVRDSRERAKAAPDVATEVPQHQHGGILRQPMLPGQRTLGGPRV